MKRTICSREFRVRMDLGLHLRPAALLVKTAYRFRSRLVASSDGRAVNAKSLLSLMTLDVSQGAVIRFFAEGPDAEDLLAAIGELFVRGFYEPCSKSETDAPVVDSVEDVDRPQPQELMARSNI